MEFPSTLRSAILDLRAKVSDVGGFNARTDKIASTLNEQGGEVSEVGKRDALALLDTLEGKNAALTAAIQTLRGEIQKLIV